MTCPHCNDEHAGDEAPKEAAAVDQKLPLGGSGGWALHCRYGAGATWRATLEDLLALIPKLSAKQQTAICDVAELCTDCAEQYEAFAASSRNEALRARERDSFQDACNKTLSSFIDVSTRLAEMTKRAESAESKLLSVERDGNGTGKWWDLFCQTGRQLVAVTTERDAAITQAHHDRLELDRIRGSVSGLRAQIESLSAEMAGVAGVDLLDEWTDERCDDTSQWEPYVVGQPCAAIKSKNARIREHESQARASQARALRWVHAHWPLIDELRDIADKVERGEVTIP